MLLHRRNVLTLLAATALIPSSWAIAATKPDDQTIEDAYLYLLARMLVIRQEHIDMAEPGITYNVAKYNALGSANFVNPNFDVAYLEAWFAVDERTPVMLEVPEVTNRYYTAQILDEWGEVIVNINERTFPSKPFGKFAVVAPGWNGVLPADVTPIELHSNKGKLIGRVELKGDPEGAVALQKAFKVTALGTPMIKPPPFVPYFTNKELIGAAIFDDAEAVLASAPDVLPTAAAMQQKVRFVSAYVRSGAEERNAVEQLLRHKIIPEFMVYAFTKSAPYRNHWLGGGQTGNYGPNYRLRTVVNFAGIWANTPEEVIYFVATRDANENPLNGSNSYVIHFPADKLPQSVVDSYWSIILVSVPDYRVVPNSLKRYNFNNHSPLKKEADGSLKIAIGPKAVAGVPEANWLPSPEGKQFSLTFRTYVPKEEVRTGAWAPPPVTKI